MRRASLFVSMRMFSPKWMPCVHYEATCVFSPQRTRRSLCPTFSRACQHYWGGWPASHAFKSMRSPFDFLPLTVFHTPCPPAHMDTYTQLRWQACSQLFMHNSPFPFFFFFCEQTFCASLPRSTHPCTWGGGPTRGCF